MRKEPIIVPQDAGMNSDQGTANGTRKEISLIVLEDTAIDPHPEIQQPTKHGGYKFCWHTSFQPQVIIGRPDVLDRYTAFLCGTADQEWGKLEDPAIVFLDLGLDPAKDRRKIDEVNSWPGVRARDLPDNRKVALYALSKILDVTESKFSGVVVLATAQRTGYAVALLRRFIERFNEIVGRYTAQEGSTRDVVVRQYTKGEIEDGGVEVVIVDRSTRATVKKVLVEVGLGGLTDTELVPSIINRATELFLRHFGIRDVEQQLWPLETRPWFIIDQAKIELAGIDEIINVIPHNFPSIEAEVKEVRDAIKEYLTGVLGFPPPELWLSPVQLSWLFEDLKYLVGRYSVAQGNPAIDDPKLEYGMPSRNLTLGNVVLLLARACGERANDWISNIKWGPDNSGLWILPKPFTPSLDEARKHVRETVFALVGKEVNEQKGLFPLLVLDEKDTKKCFVKAVQLTQTGLRIELAHDFSIQHKSDRQTLIKKIAGNEQADGQTYAAWRHVDTLLGTAPGIIGHRAWCRLNFYVEGGQTIWEWSLTKDGHLSPS